MKLWIVLGLVFLTAGYAQAEVASLEQALTAVQQEQAREQTLVTSPEHVSRLYYHGAKTAKAVLVIHGLSESPKYMESVSRHFYDKGYNVYSILLSGHQHKNEKDFDTVTYDKWVRDAENGFAVAQQLGDQVELVGYSLGGTLSAYLTLKYPGQVRAMYLIAPAFALSLRVFVGASALGWTTMDSTQICQNPDSFLCKLYFQLDPALQPIAAEGLVVSPAAGAQVEALLRFIANQFGPELTSEDLEDPTWKVRMYETFSKLNVPIAMVNSMDDDTVDHQFNQDFIDDYKYEKTSLMLTTQQNISHTFLGKGPLDAFVHTKPGYNIYFNDVLATFDHLNVP